MSKIKDYFAQSPPARPFRRRRYRVHAASSVTTPGISRDSTAPSCVDTDGFLGTVFLDSSSPPVLIGTKGNDLQLVTISAGRNLTVSMIAGFPAGARITIARTPYGQPARIAIASDSKTDLLQRVADGWRVTTLPALLKDRGTRH